MHNERDGVGTNCAPCDSSGGEGCVDDVVQAYHIPLLKNHSRGLATLYRIGFPSNRNSRVLLVVRVEQDVVQKGHSSPMDLRTEPA